ncbi:hypothetical protein AG1IA_03233 [Rhizoctonia solani AG-1 IA]|uniref:Uncharacterized protein n=1 Tax=Thanatephorus cucumeris (strain AG1-IA) TaxID=983506 RepID=L8X0W2_THACA|nr:hypothetical protein AG1IA_03233 [Rhizoctonia solani AG-1 IA]
MTARTLWCNDFPGFRSQVYPGHHQSQVYDRSNTGPSSSLATVVSSNFQSLLLDVQAIDPLVAVITMLANVIVVSSALRPASVKCEKLSQLLAGGALTFDTVVMLRRSAADISSPKQRSVRITRGIFRYCVIEPGALATIKLQLKVHKGKDDRPQHYQASRPIVSDANLNLFDRQKKRTTSTDLVSNIANQGASRHTLDPKHLASTTETNEMREKPSQQQRRITCRRTAPQEFIGTIKSHWPVTHLAWFYPPSFLRLDWD